MECVFCRIRDGQIPSVKLFEDEKTMAFMDINPINDGHLLVATKEHAPTIFDISGEDLQATILTTQKMAKAVQEALSPDGLNLLQANGPAAFQSVPHFHIHVVPRWNNDGKGLTWGLVRGELEKIKAVAERIREAI